MPASGSLTKRKNSANASPGAKSKPKGKEKEAAASGGETNKKTDEPIAKASNLSAEKEPSERDHDHDHEHVPNPFILFIIFNAFVFAFLYGVYYLVQNPSFVTSCTDSQPLVNIQDNFLNHTIFSRLTKCLEKHPLVKPGTELSDTSFRGTRGFVIKFSEQGIPDFREHEHFACLAPYFDTVRQKTANAFVMNLLICEIPAGHVGNANANGVAVGLHLDNTLGIKSWKNFLAHQVNVLYAMVPEDIVGGELQLYPFEDGPINEDEDQPAEIVSPKENRMVEFKGNAYHRVMQFTTKTNVTRVSLVLEQYKVPEKYKPQLVRSSFERRKGIAMM